MEQKSSRGGVREGAGRPRKDEELMVINLLDKHIDRDFVAIELYKRIKMGYMKAISLYLQYIYGKPVATINQTTTLNVSDIDISDLIRFDDKKEDK